MDETAPTIAITSPVAGDNVINKTEAAAGVTISGTATAGSAAVNGQTATITIIDGTNTVKGIYTATVTSGAWSVNVTAAQAQGLADGSYNIKANVADIAGNSATTASQAITVDETAPSIAIASPVAGDNIINKSEAAAGVTLSGTATAGTGGAAVNGQTATITIVDSTNAVKDTYAATVTSGAWSVNVTAAQAQALADGSYSIKANVSDAAGNAATTASQAITVDETAPTIAITSPVAGDNIINKSEAAAGVTISGTAAAGSAGVNGQTATITIVDSTNAVKDTYTATVTAGAWSVNVTAAQAQALADGSYSIKANVSDAAGNAATTVSQTVAVETLAPTVLISTTGTTTNQASQTISGTVAATEAAAGSTVTLFDTVNSVTTQIGTATVVGGSWSTTVTLPGSGTHSIVAQDTDAAGNIGSSTPVVFTLATAAPSISITAPVAGDNIINKSEAAAGVTVSGTAAAGTGGAAVNGQTATITIVDSSNAVRDTYTTTVTAGAWSVNVTAAQAQGLADGSYSIKANVSDTAGNAATTATQAITVDETAPTIAITSPVAGDNIINKTEAAAGVTISGTATAGSAGVNGQTATITIVDSANAVKDTYTTTVTAGVWSVNVTAPQAQALADGSYSIKANLSDAAGNAATTASQAITVDETAPSIAITAPVAGDNIINKSRGGGGCHHQRHGCSRQRGGERPDRDDHDRRQHQHRQGHLCGDRDEWGVVGERDRGAGARPGRRQLQHQGECVGCGRQCGDHGDASNHGGRDRADDRDHKPCCRGQHHQQERGGGRRHHQWHRHGRERRGKRPDRDDHDRRQHQRRQGHLCGDRDERGVVGEHNGGAGASPGRRQLQHQGECLGCGRQCSDHGDAGDHAGYSSADGDDKHRGRDHKSVNADDLRHRGGHRGRGRLDGDVV